MATATYIPVDEYLLSVFRPDREYVDGQIIERNVGEKSHSKCQGLIFAHFLKLSETIALFPSIEWRVQVAHGRFRVPDVCVVAGAEPDEQILTTPPFIVIEVLSPEDRLSAMQHRFDDYLKFDVPYIWIVDPIEKRAWTCTGEGLFEVKDLELKTKSPDVSLPLREIFDRIR